MTDTPPPAASWPRPYWHPSAEQVILHFYVFGTFPPELVIPAPRYGSPGLPAGMTIERFQHAALRHWEGYPLADELGGVLRDDTPEAFEQSRVAPDVLVVRGQLADAATLDYLRDTLGVLAGLLDIGAVSILDPQTLRLFSAADWRGQFLLKGGAPARNHVLIVHTATEDQPQRSWVRTRGMRKFGRPDISIHHVPERDVDRAGALCLQLVELQALGAHFAADQPLTVEGLPSGLVAKPGGDMGDPRFNNTHVAFRWPD